MKIPSRILAGIALAELLLAGPEISSALGAYDNGLLTLVVPAVSYGIVAIGPLVVIGSIVVALAIWAIAFLSNLAVLIGGVRVGFARKSAITTLFVLSALVFIGLLLALTNFEHVFVKRADAGRESIWALAVPVAFVLTARLY